MAVRSALVVASDDYGDPKLLKLRAPAIDAEHLARVLGDSAIGDFDVDVLLNEPEYRVRRRLSSFFSDRHRDDLLFVHFSCHGVKDDDGHLYFATSDTEMRNLDATAVSAEFVNRQMARSRSHRIALFLDCCYSGAFSRGALVRAGDQVDLADRFDGRGQVVITASTAMEYAFEGDELTGEGTPSVFTSTLVEGLETGAADLDGDALVSVDELYDYLYDRVRERNPNQTPSKWVYDLRGDLYLAHTPGRAQTPAELPADLQDALGSAFVSAREHAAAELARLLRGRHRGIALAAEQALEQLVEDDSRRVAEAATRALEEHALQHPAGMISEAGAEDAPLPVAEPEPSQPEAPTAPAEPAAETVSPREEPAPVAQAVTPPAAAVERRWQPTDSVLIGIVLLALAGAGISLAAVAVSWTGFDRSFALVAIGAPLLVILSTPAIVEGTMRDVAAGSLLALGVEEVAGALVLLSLSASHAELFVVGAALELAAGLVSVYLLLRTKSPGSDDSRALTPQGGLSLALGILGATLLVPAMLLPFAAHGLTEFDVGESFRITDAEGGGRWTALQPVAGIAGIAAALFVAALVARWRGLANGMLLGFAAYVILLFLAYVALASTLQKGPGLGALLGIVGGVLVLAAAAVGYRGWTAFAGR